MYNTNNEYFKPVISGTRSFSLINLYRIAYSEDSEKLLKITSIFFLLAPMKHVISVVESTCFMEAKTQTIDFSRSWLACERSMPTIKKNDK